MTVDQCIILDINSLKKFYPLPKNPKLVLFLRGQQRHREISFYYCLSTNNYSNGNSPSSQTSLLPVLYTTTSSLYLTTNSDFFESEHDSGRVKVDVHT